MFIQKDSIDVVIVTYGNRWGYVEKVLTRAISFEEVNTVTVVNNDSTYDVNLKVNEIFYGKKVYVENPGVNLGSAGGYKLGIQSSIKQQGELIWLLDDDNLPSKESIKNMIIAASNLKNEKVALTCYRKNWINKTSKEVNDIQNTFFEFSLINKLKRKKNNDNSSNLSKRLYVPYGGLLFEKKALKEVGLPNEDMYLYVDDTDFTFKFTKVGYTIYCLFDAEIVDLEDSWAQKVSEPLFKAIFNVDDPYRGLMNIRNRAYFEKNNLVINNTVYFFNVCTYLIYIFIFYMPKNKKGLSLFKKIIKTIQEGRKENLGPKI